MEGRGGTATVGGRVACNRARLQVSDLRLGVVAVEAALARLLYGCAFDEIGRHRVTVAVLEAVANAVEHGNRGSPGAWVSVDMCVAGPELVVIVGDEGGGYDPGTVPDARAPGRLLAERGRGVLLMTALVDHVRTALVPSGGFEVELRADIRDKPTREG